MENLLNSLSQVENIRFNLGDFELSRNQPERRELRPFENHFLSQYFQGSCKEALQLKGIDIDLGRTFTSHYLFSMDPKEHFRLAYSDHPGVRVLF